jgi:prepilin-type N-terminal cleavage/methylation domain-containing protein/prepilin-type processing-associated H-X9-DG protein
MRRSGLTLIELLVTIVIVAVLVAVLIPSLHRSRLQAKATVCTSNIRQLSLALFTYATDNGRFPYGFYNDPNMLPPESGYAGNASYDRKGWWWFNYLEGRYEKSMGGNTVLQCPSKNLQHPKLGDDILCGNYGVNLSICKMSSGRKSRQVFIGEPLTSIEVRRPSQTLLVLDSGYAIISWWHVADEPPVTLGNSIIEDTAYVPGLKINKDRLLWPGGGQNYDALFGRHPRKTVNIGFLDGHVGRSSADDLLVEKSSEEYKNLVPLWLSK